jgi:AbrB family looped-hinge helix DNA binding protein
MLAVVFSMVAFPFLSGDDGSKQHHSHKPMSLTCSLQMPILSHRVRYVEHDMQSRTRMNGQGRIVIPAECRAAAGIKPGDDLLIEPVGEGELRVRTRRQALKNAQEIVAKYSSGRDLVAELIAERREEARRESE